MTRRAALVAVFLLLSLAGALSPLGAQTAKHLNFNSNDWPPYFVGDRGFAREILQLCLPAAGYAPRFSAVTVEQMFPALQSGVLDGHVMSRTAERERYVEFGKEPLFHDSYHPIIRRGSNIPVTSLRDLDKVKKLGHLAGVRYSPEYLDYVRARREAGTLIEASSNEEIVRMLLDGKIDAFVSLASSTRWLAASWNARDKIEVLPLEIKASDYYLGLSRTSKRLQERPKVLAAFDACVAGLKRDGRYQRLLAQYDLTDAQQ